MLDFNVHSVDLSLELEAGSQVDLFVLFVIGFQDRCLKVSILPDV